MIYAFQLRKFAIVEKKGSLEVQKINIDISSTLLPLMSYKIVHWSFEITKVLFTVSYY